MKRSGAIKLMTVTGLTTLLLGGMWVAAGSQNSGTENPFQTSNESFIVPIGNFGDQAEYDVLEHEDGKDSRHTARWTFDGPERVLDKAGRPRAVASIDVDTAVVTGEGNVWGGSRKLYLDLDSRQQIRQDEPTGTFEYKGLYDSPYNPLAYSINFSRVKLGPIGTGFPSHDMTRVVGQIQGLPLRVGDDLSSTVGFVGPPTHQDAYEQSVRVTGKAILTSTAVWSIHVAFHERETYHRDTGLLREREWMNLTLWVSETSPVPLRIELDYHEYNTPDGKDERNDEWLGNDVATLVAFRRGSSPIPWGTTHVEAPPIFVGGERSDKPYVTSGSEFRGTFPVEEAVNSVESDATLVDFELWKQENPGWQVVGMEAWPGRVDGRGPDPLPRTKLQPFDGAVQMWNLHYSAPFGETVFLVQSYKDSNGVIINAVGPERQGQPVPVGQRFDPSWIPDTLLTFAAADRFWASIVDPASNNLGPNIMRWGFYHPASAQEDLGKIFYGRATEAERLVEQLDVSFVAIDASTGEFLSGQFESWSPRVREAVLPPVAGADPNAVPVAAPPTPNNILPLAAGAASISLLVLVAIYLFPLLQQGAVGLYSKLVKHQLLDHELRDELISLIRENPGIAPPALKAMTGSSWSTIIYHLSVLRNNDLVTSVRDGRHRRYFIVGSMHHRKLPGLAILQNPRTRQVRDLIAAQPGIDRPAMARMLGVTPAAVTWHLKRLAANHLLETKKSGTLVRYFLAKGEPAGADVLLVQSGAVEPVPVNSR